MNRQEGIKVDGLTYTYDKAREPSLVEINLAISKGEFVAVMGETGAGKTSLLMTLNGLIPQFMEGNMTGTVEISGYSTQRIPVQNLTREIGLVLQDPETQIFGLNVWEDVAFGPSNFGIPIDVINKRVQQSLDLVGLSGYENRSTEFLSGGEKQRLATAGILAIGPKILVLDEPTSELDPEGKDAIFQIVKKLQKEHGMTIVIAEHESEKVLEYADHVVVLQQGKIVWNGEPSILFSEEERVRSFNLRPPGVALIYWNLKSKGIQLGEVCPRTVTEMEERLQKLLYQSNPQPFSWTGLGKDKADLARNAERDREQPILEVKELSQVYSNGHEALKEINLKVYEGEFIAIIGQNGAGKSTLCKHFNRLLSPTRGQIYYQGENIADKTTSQLAREIGYVFQNPDHQIFSATVLEEVIYGLKIQGHPLDKQERKAREVLALVGLERYIDRHPFSLSKGLRQRLAVASVLALEPKILIIDEPTTGQDWSGSENMLQLLHQLHRRGHTIILITHNMNIVTEHVKRVIMMEKGKILKDCRPNEAFIDEEVLQLTKVKPSQIVKIAQWLEKEHRFPPGLITEEELMDALLERVGIYA